MSEKWSRRRAAHRGCSVEQREDSPPKGGSYCQARFAPSDARQERYVQTTADPTPSVKSCWAVPSSLNCCGRSTHILTVRLTSTSRKPAARNQERKQALFGSHQSQLPGLLASSFCVGSGDRSSWTNVEAMTC